MYITLGYFKYEGSELLSITNTLENAINLLNKRFFDDKDFYLKYVDNVLIKMINDNIDICYKKNDEYKISLERTQTLFDGVIIREVEINENL